MSQPPVESVKSSFSVSSAAALPRWLSPLCSSWMYLAVRLLLAGVFVYAGAVKLADVHGFALVIEEYGIIYGNLARLTAIVLPALEVLAGAALLFDMRGSLTAVTAMTVFFMGILAYAMLTGLTIGDCGCFEPGELPEGIVDGSAVRQAFYRDIGLLCCSGYLYWWRAAFRKAS